MTVMLVIVGGFFVFSCIKDIRKTWDGVKKGLRMFINIVPSILTVLIFVSIAMYMFPKEVITSYLGAQAGWKGIAISGVLGSISMIPGFIAYPLSGVLRSSGVSFMNIAVFINTLIMVGIITLPIEIKYYGLKVSVLRNFLSLIAALLIGLIIGVVL